MKNTEENKMSKEIEEILGKKKEGELQKLEEEGKILSPEERDFLKSTTAQKQQ